ncbi:MAG TPA: response regulator transcription factor [Ktedonobacterales bacterium]|jgi:DNA-binding response OmpR family regulator
MRILVVEDERHLATVLRRVFTEEHYQVDLAYDGPSGYELAAKNAYDLVVLDLMLPGMDGLEICRQLRADQIFVPILMLTARGAVEDRVAGLRSGGDDYVIKPFAMEELLARVQALLRRASVLESATQLQVGDLFLDLLRHEATRNGEVIELTAKEFGLLEYLMRHPGHVLTRMQILDHVWFDDIDRNSNIVDIYIHYLRDKVDRGFERPVIKTIRGVGYKLEA